MLILEQKDIFKNLILIIKIFIVFKYLYIYI